MVQHLQQFAFWNLIIRPPRAKYPLDVLGPADFSFEGGRGRRRDVEIKTSRGSLVQCSHFLPYGRGLKKIPVVVYLHGNASNRLEAFDVVVPFLQRRVSVFCFDAAGCGISEGDYISCGWHESQDLRDVLLYLRKSPFCGPVALWGWSMGAVTALLYTSRDDTIAALCCESPFASLRRVCEDLATGGTHISVKLPAWLLEPVYSFVNRQVQSLAFFDIDEVVPLDSAKRIRTPAIFITRKNDSFIQPHHMTDILAVYGGEHEHIELEGDHTCTRTAETIAKIADFFCRTFVSHIVAAELSSARNDEDESTIADEHAQDQPRASFARRLLDDLQEDSLLAPVAWEPIRAMPRWLETAGLGFPEPKSEPAMDRESVDIRPNMQPLCASPALGITARSRLSGSSRNSGRMCHES